jgi:putative nucleotidyltransferase with HDIG domain
MTTWEAYETYRIMPNLRLHQLRVAALARELALALGADHDMVTKAGLLHDMGNIMKTDFTQFPPEFYGEKGIEYWQQVQKECGERYGADEHAASEAIVREIGVGDEVLQLVGAMGFSKAKQILAEGSLELQILEYADQRVAPQGIVSMNERLQEGHARYKKRVRSDYGKNDQQFEENYAVCQEIEKKLFAGLLITPEMLTEASLTSTIESLKDYQIV